MKRTLWVIFGIATAILIALLVAGIISSANFLHRPIALGLSLTQLMGITTALVIVGGALWKVPKWQVAGLVREGVKSDKVADLENSARDTLAKILGGAFFLGTLYFTGESLKIERLKEDASEKGQITERFTHAVDQLGNKDRNTRVGGIYALERVAEEFPQDYQWTVTEILAAFIRQQAPLKSGRQTALLSCDKLRPRGTPAKQPEVDVQTALEVIGRRQLEYAPPLNGQPRAVDLRHTDLRGANLTTANLEYAALTDSNLEAASITSANLRHATLRGVNLTCAFMPESDLEGADLADASGLTCNQIRSVHSDSSTVFPSYLKGGDCSQSAPQTVAPPSPR